YASTRRFLSSSRRHTSFSRDWSSDVCSSDLESGEDWIDVGLGKIKVTAERDPSKLPHKALNVDIALECTGIFTSRDKAAAHLTRSEERRVGKVEIASGAGERRRSSSRRTQMG